MNTKINTVIIENVYPELDGGRFPVKRSVGDRFEVEADIFTHGHDIIKAVLQYKKTTDAEWTETEMVFTDNDRWKGSFVLEENTIWDYTVFAWRDPFLSWASDLEKKYKANQNITSDLLEGKKLVDRALQLAVDTSSAGTDAAEDAAFLRKIITHFNTLIKAHSAAKAPAVEKAADSDTIKEIISGTEPYPLGTEPYPLGTELRGKMYRYADRSDCGAYSLVLKVMANRTRAEYGSWYEMWHRSQGKKPGKSATFDDMKKRLPEISGMGFDVVYLPPIHPVGITNRKGPDNSLVCPPGCPGSSFAVGSSDGGHMAVNPEFGTLDDFRSLVRECRALKMEIALDLALQTSPDHPWVKEHPEWFYHQPDGSIKFAENPPKKYEDIYPINFNTEDKEGLWSEIRKIVRFWMDQGVRIFRVDNPHTKPVFFWKWLIDDILSTDPDVIFLAEAFTRPKMMKVLAKAGFQQSYTYFTWRNYKQEFIDYFTELTQEEPSEYMIGNLFTNTPDILPVVLQNAPPSAFKMRAVLAATLSPTWGMYNGFELCEGTPRPGTEEYLHSEKYEYKVWDWNRPGNIKEFIRRLNMIRRENPALQKYRNLKFHKADNDNILFYGKSHESAGEKTKSLAKDNILCVVNLDPHNRQESFVYVPIWEYSLGSDEPYQVRDLLTNEVYTWKGERNFISLNPEKMPAHILLVTR